ncbi:MAG: hypothetical protein AAGA12_06335 [Pseudomonadota bacterium]
MSTSSNSGNSRRRPRFTTQPSISGTLIVGEALALSPGVASPGPITYEVVRLRLDGVDKLTEIADMAWNTAGEDVSAGGILTYRVRARNANGAALSQLISVVLAPPAIVPEFSVQPSLSGVLEVGEVVTLAPGTATPGPITYDITTLTVDGIDQLGNVTGTSWNTSSVDVSGGGAILYQVTATNVTGSTLSTVVSATLEPEPIPAPSFTAQPSISGMFEVGEVLTLSLGTALPEPVSLAISSFTLDGVDKVAALSGLIWDTTGEDVSGGGAISLQVTATNVTGQTSSDIITATLDPEPLVPPTFLLQPQILGSLEVGQTLTFDPGAAQPAPVTLEITSLSLDGVDKRAELVGLDWDTTGEDVSAGGLIEFQITATNPDGSTLSDVISATLNAAAPLGPWVFETPSDGAFDILASTGNTGAPDVLDLGTGAVFVGDPGPGWLVIPAGDQRLRILQSISNPAAPVVADTGDGQIQLGA